MRLKESFLEKVSNKYWGLVGHPSEDSILLRVYIFLWALLLERPTLPFRIVMGRARWGRDYEAFRQASPFKDMMPEWRS